MNDQIDPRKANFRSLTVKYSSLQRLSNPLLSAAQVQVLNQRTPDDDIYERPAKGGGTWYFIKATRVIKNLNLITGYRWSTKVVWEDIKFGQAVVKMELSATFTDPKTNLPYTVTKTDYGRADVKLVKGTSKPMDIGNDLKAATSDALKRCYRQFGGALDVYAANEYVEVLMSDEEPESLKDKELKKITSQAKEDLIKQRKEEQ